MRFSNVTQKLINVHLITTDHRPPESVPSGTQVWGDRGMDLEQYHNPGATTAYLIRPDGYIAYAHKPAQLGHLLSYLNEMPYTNGRVGSQNSPEKTFVLQTPPKKEDMMTTEDRPQIITMPLRGVNAYLVRGNQNSILVDTGFPGMEDTILDKLSKSGVSPEEISLILLTHGHPDHAGSAAALKKRLGVPVAIHALECDWARTGLSEIPQPIRLFGRLIKAITKPEFPSFEPDILLEEGTSLQEYGLTGEDSPHPRAQPRLYLAPATRRRHSRGRRDGWRLCPREQARLSVPRRRCTPRAEEHPEVDGPRASTFVLRARQAFGRQGGSSAFRGRR